MADNAFIRIDDFAKAQRLADLLSPDPLHRILDQCPVILPRRGYLYPTRSLEPHADRIVYLSGIPNRRVVDTAL